MKLLFMLCVQSTMFHRSTLVLHRDALRKRRKQDLRILAQMGIGNIFGRAINNLCKYESTLFCRKELVKIVRALQRETSDIVIATMNGRSP